MYFGMSVPIAVLSLTVYGQKNSLAMYADLIKIQNMTKPEQCLSIYRLNRHMLLRAPMWTWHVEKGGSLSSSTSPAGITAGLRWVSFSVVSGVQLVLSIRPLTTQLFPVPVHH